MIIPNTWKNKKLSKPPTSWLPDGNSNIGSFLEVLLDMKFLEQQKKHEASVFPDPKWFKCLKALVTIGENVVVQYFQQRTNHPQSMMFPYFTIEMLSGRLTKGHIYMYVYIYVFAIPCFNDDQNFTEDGWRILLDEPEVSCDSSFFCLISPEIHHENRWCNRVVAFCYHLKGWC